MGLARADLPQQQHAATFPAMLRKVVDVVGARIQGNLLGRIRHDEIGECLFRETLRNPRAFMLNDPKLTALALEFLHVALVARTDGATRQTAALENDR
ncbi:hypothetical protein D3C75_777430 [compost metagenome]